MEGLVEEGAELIKEKADFEAEALDAGLIGAAQRVEHYEIAAYGTARTFAEQLGYQDAVLLLQQTLTEEYAADEKLTALAEGSINPKAA
jgi:ferritin-like metal-binding protein YciE